MWISRVRITGGFLNGVDVSFKQGLNVVIGARGAGKTSLLELIRHAVGAEHADQRTDSERTKFLASVLGSGEIILDLESDDGGRHLVVDANGGGQRPDLSNQIIVLGQSELENIASDGTSRLRLLDIRAGSDQVIPDLTRISEVTGRLFDLRAELELLREDSAKRETLEKDKGSLTAQEAALMAGNTTDLTGRRDDLRNIEQSLTNTTNNLRAFELADSVLTEIYSEQKSQTSRLYDLQKSIENDISLNTISSHVLKMIQLSEELLTAGSESKDRISAAKELAISKNFELRETAAPLRASLEEAEEGLGQITAQLRNVNAELTQLDEKNKTIKSLTSEYERLIEDRKFIFSEIDKAEQDLFDTRSEAARETSSRISNNVTIDVEHMSESGEFQAFVTAAAKGSNTRSVTIEAVTEKMLPRQLLEILEQDDASSLSVASDLPLDRSSKLIQNLYNREILTKLSTISLGDSVDFKLRDGTLEKSVDSLSTGQKCAVTLPVVLSEKYRTLVLDQPEDHLDNAYLVDHVVEGMKRRGSAQTIVATHNANIPVLGSAETVIVLVSDGIHGSITNNGKFDQQEIVNSITELMEGGKEAFALRSEFYSKHGGQ